MANQLSYCILSNVSPLDSSTNSYIRIRFDVTSGSSTLTNITDVGGTYSGLNDVRPGQILRAAGSFTETTIVSVNTASATIVVSDGALTDETNELARIAPGEGEYFIPTASLSDPQQLIDYSNITGSEDSEYIAGTNRYGVLGKAFRNGAIVPGRFHLYEIVNASGRNPSNSEAKLYIRWYESGSEADSGDTMATQASQTTALLEISDTNELVPIFKSRIVSGFNLDGGEEVAAYQIALESFFDALSTGSASVSSSFATTASYAHTASVLTGTVTSASYSVTASYAVSSSHEIIKEISSSYADTASLALDIQWSSISNIPSGLLSSSAQIKEYNVFATTGSNLFTDDQTIDGLLILGTQSGTPTFVSGGIYVDSNYDLYLGSI